MDLLFTTLEVVAVAASVGIIALIANDGESHWMEGVQLLAVYTILGIAFFFLPVWPRAYSTRAMHLSRSLAPNAPLASHGP